MHGNEHIKRWGDKIDLDLFKGEENCQMAVYSFLGCKKKNAALLQKVPRDIVLMIGKLVWASRESREWELVADDWSD